MKYINLLDAMRSIGTQVTIRKKSHLAYQGEVPRYGYYILDGAVKAYVISADGTQTVADIYARHTIVPIAWLNRTSSTAIFYYETINDVRAIRFTRDEFEQAVCTSHLTKDDYVKYLAASQTSQLLRSAGLCQPSADRKICYAFYMLVHRYGIEREKGRFIVNIPLTHETIGNFIGQSRENTAKTIKQLCEKDVLAYQSKIYTINLPRLEQYIGEEGFRNLNVT